MKNIFKVLFLIITVILIFSCVQPMNEKSKSSGSKKDNDSESFNTNDLLTLEGIKQAAENDDYYYSMTAEESDRSISVENPEIGDVNSNGRINICDALMTARYALGYKVYNFNEYTADTDMDGFIDLNDAVSIVKYCAGIYEKLPMNIIKNGYFNNNADNWFNYATSPADASLEIDNNQAVISIKNQGVNLWDIGFGQNGINIESGYTYKLSFKAKSVAVTPK